MGIGRDLADGPGGDAGQDRDGDEEGPRGGWAGSGWCSEELPKCSLKAPCVVRATCPFAWMHCRRSRSLGGLSQVSRLHVASTSAGRTHCRAAGTSPHAGVVVPRVPTDHGLYDFRTVHLGVLGPLQVSGPTGDVALTGRNDRVVLTALAAWPNEALSADRLVDALWGERPPRSSSKVLQNVVLRLRKHLGGSLIETRPGGYALRALEVDIDARRFELDGARRPRARSEPRLGRRFGGAGGRGRPVARAASS